MIIKKIKNIISNTKMNPNNIMFNPYVGVDPRNLSTAALCWDKNQVASCVNFTPNTNINKYSSNVFHGHDGAGVRFINVVPKSRKNIPGVPTPLVPQ
jgi:hypothetical protein